MKNYRLYLVRHGVTQGNLDGWAAGFAMVWFHATA